MNEKDRPRLLAQFNEEAAEHIEALSSLMLTLEAHPGDEAAVVDLLRHAHSLKGASKLVGGTALERLTHAVETLLAEVRARRVSPVAEVADALLASVDAMRSALARLMEGITDGGSEEIVRRLLSMAASGPGLDDRLNAALPGLDREILDVLTEFQKSQLVLAREVGKTIWECELDARDSEFASRIDAACNQLKSAGDMISLAGLSSLADGRLRFKFVIATRRPEGDVAALAQSLSLILIDPSVARAVAPAAEVAADDDDEAAFAAEMAKLVARYVSETADEMTETAALVLALESHPDDQAIVNKLFRTAHNLKGSGMTYGLPAVSEVAHHLESLLDALRQRRIVASTRVTNALLVAVDTLKDLFASAREGRGAETSPPEVLLLLDEAATGTRHAEPEATTSAPSGAVPARAGSESIRVRLDKLDRLINLAGELTVLRNAREAAAQALVAPADGSKTAFRQWRALNDRLTELGSDKNWREDFEQLGGRLGNLRQGVDDVLQQFAGLTSAAETITESLQDAVMKIRMVPVALLFDTAPRMIRDLTSDKRKSVDLRIVGGDTELDKRVLEMMTDPLMHLLRNAVDHGIETTDERRQAGKPAAGVIVLSAEHRGGYITISISDDGHGMVPARLIAAAIRKGIINERDAERMTAEQAYALIFSPGFSTREQVTAISGRGVGMDVVKSNIDALKGRIEIDSREGHGTTFRVHLPLSISVIQVILVECGGQSYCLPATGVTEIIRVADHDLSSEDGQACVQHRGKAVPVVRLGDLLGINDRRPIGKSAIAITTGLEGTVGLVVDRAVAEQTVLVKEMGKLLKRVPHLSGGTILRDGSVAVILDIVSLVSTAIRSGGTWVREQAAVSSTPERKTLLVVDDSLTTRELIRGLLESAGYDVVMARHGREAWEVLQSPRPLDLVVSDVNMPEMDGYELVTKIKADRRLSRTPVVLVTSLAKPEEKLKGMQAGADAYIVKGAFDQSGLLARVRELVGSGG